MKAQWSVFLMTVFISNVVFAWAGRGHHTICEAAAHLVQQAELKKFLVPKAHTMGHLCNLPDTYWKDLGSDATKFGNATHFFDPEVIGLSIGEIPLNYESIIEKYQGTENKWEPGKTLNSIPDQFGSNWWRADQFYRRAVADSVSWSAASPPKNRGDEQNKDLPFNKFTFDFMVNLGLMGHFVGDNGQPFHNTADYDGYKVGHGGIHAYYEEAIVSAAPYNLMAKVVERAQKLIAEKPAFLTKPTTLEKMQQLSVLTFADVPKILKLDPVIKNSEMKEEKGMQLKTAAKRKPADQVYVLFEDILLTHMARSAALLANLWDQAYLENGQPKVEEYKSFRYPFTADFVMPDYYRTTNQVQK